MLNSLYRQNSTQARRDSLIFDSKITKFFIDLNNLKDSSIDIFSLIPKQDLYSLLNHILKKKERSSQDIMFLNLFLRTLTQFMSLLTKNDRRKTDIQPLLNKIAENLKWKNIHENTILFHCGDRGSNFFLIIKGSVSILIPNEHKLQMNIEDYLSHLHILFRLKERELFAWTINANREVYDVKESDFEEIDLKSTYAVYFLHMNHNPKPITYASVDDYLTLITPKPSKETYHPLLNLWTYHKVVVLCEGNTFGETALLSKNLLRTATIYVNEDSFFGTLKQNEFNACIKTIQLLLKRERTLFILSFNLFNNVNYDVFIRKYWNYFTYNQIKQGEILFKQGDQREMIYFLKEGTIELMTRLSLKDINRLIDYFEPMENGTGAVIPLTASKEHYMSLAKEHRIAIIRNKDLIGLNDVIDDHKEFFCTATCTSTKAAYFGIHIKLFNHILEVLNCEDLEYAQLTDMKMTIMLNRLKTIKHVLMNSIIVFNFPDQHMQSVINAFNPIKHEVVSCSPIEKVYKRAVSSHGSKKRVINNIINLQPSPPIENEEYDKGIQPRNRNENEEKMTQCNEGNHKSKPILKPRMTLLSKYLIKSNKFQKFKGGINDKRYLPNVSSIVAITMNHASTAISSMNNTKSISLSNNTNHSTSEGIGIGMIDLLIYDKESHITNSRSNLKKSRNKHRHKHNDYNDKLPLNYMLKAKPMKIRLKKMIK